MSYQTEYGDYVPSCGHDQWTENLRKLVEVDGISALQLVEGVGYSLAMVVRYALGLSALEGKVTLAISDGFFSWSALTTARHLVDAGSTVSIAHFGNGAPPSRETEVLLKPLLTRNCSLIEVNSPDSLSQLSHVAQNSHNIICALRDPKASDAHELLPRFYAFINECPVPAHVVGIPPGIDFASGEVESSPLYASSTLSLGLPFRVSARAHDLIGRHYLADMQWDIPTYRKLGYHAAPLFREQPVIKLRPQVLELGVGVEQ